jgi:hypothetical protein
MCLVGLERYGIWDGQGRLLHSVALGVHIVYLGRGI